MSDHDVVGYGLSAYFRAIQARAHELIEPLSTQELWIRPHSYGNSIGNLILHLTGNLNYYIGARIAETGYVRHRDEEFTGSASPKSNSWPSSTLRSRRWLRPSVNSRTRIGLHRIRQSARRWRIASVWC